MSDLRQRLDGGEVIVLVGAVARSSRGAVCRDAACSAAALITHPDTVREVHEDCIQVGVDIITTNTFATARHVLKPTWMGEQLCKLNARAVALAKEARAAA